MYFFVFPGQGSQHPGMGRFLFDNFQSAKSTFEEASDSLKFDLKKLCFNGSESDLALTENTQPAILTTSIATQKVLQKDLGVPCSIVAGHSIGEYAALVTAEVLSFSDAVQAVRIRGQAMQSAVPIGKGAMAAAIGLDSDQAQTLCQYVVQESGKGPLSPANYNCPGQIVLSGSNEAIQWMIDHAKPENIWTENAPKRIRLIPLQVSAPFHCEMMAPAEKKMREVLTALDFLDAKIPVIQNFTAAKETKGPQLKENLIRQVSAPVKWMQTMELAKKLGFSKVIECGAGKVLHGLFKKMDPEFFQVMSTTSLEEIKGIEAATKGFR